MRFANKIIFAGVMLALVVTLARVDLAAAQDKKEVSFAMLPQMANADLFKAWLPILQYLEQQTGLKFTQQFPKNFDDHVQLCQQAAIDIAYTNPISYVQMTPKNGVGHTAIAIAVDAEGATMFGQIIARADNEAIKEFKDIKGKKGWVVGFKSAGGYTFQQAYALGQGFDLNKDCQISEAPENKQEKVVMAVYNRETEFGCIRNGILEKMGDRIDPAQVKVLAETPRYPGWVISVSSKVDPAVVAKVKAAFASIPADIMKQAALPGKILSFQPAGDADFDGMRELVGRLNAAI